MLSPGLELLQFNANYHPSLSSTMSLERLSQPGATQPNEDWLSHRLNFLPLPLVITNLLPQISKRISFDASGTSSLTAPEQLHCAPAQLSKQQAERCINPTDIVDTPTETRPTRCFSLPGSYKNLYGVQAKDKTQLWLWLMDNRAGCIE